MSDNKGKVPPEPFVLPQHQPHRLVIGTIKSLNRQFHKLFVQLLHQQSKVAHLLQETKSLSPPLPPPSRQGAELRALQRFTATQEKKLKKENLVREKEYQRFRTKRR